MPNPNKLYAGPIIKSIGLNNGLLTLLNQIYERVPHNLSHESACTYSKNTRLMVHIRSRPHQEFQVSTKMSLLPLKLAGKYIECCRQL